MKNKTLSALNAYIPFEGGGQIPLARTLKAQRAKDSLGNYIRKDGLGSTAVLEMIYEE